MAAQLTWPGHGTGGVGGLVLDTLLPMARDGLDEWGVAAGVRARLLAVIEGRARTGRNGASWQVSTVAAFERRGLDRPAALAAMLRSYCALMHSNEPVHRWEVPA